MRILFAATLLAAVAFTACDSADAQSFRPRYKTNPDRSGTSSKLQNRTIELRVLIDKKSAIGTNHEWMQALAEVGADRVVAETSRVKEPSFKEIGEGALKTLRIVGIVKRGALYLPGGKFRITQTTAIRNHLKKLRDDGAEITIAEKVAFGLTAKQLLSVHDRMGAQINSATKGQSASKLAKRILELSGYPTQIEKSAQRMLSNSEAVVEVELNGYTLGTGLAIALRPMGLVFEPKRPQGQQVQLMVRVADEKQKNWPVGWPVTVPTGDAAPKLMVKVPIKAQQAEILKLLSAIEGRVELPFFFDHAKIRAKGIDLESTKVTYAREKKSSYDMVIDKVLNQCKPKLKSELRIDEVGKKFLWITPR